MNRVLLGFQWQAAPSRDVSGEYRIRFSGWTTLGQNTCLYTWARLVVHHWWVENRCERRKKKYEPHWYKESM